MLEMAEVLEASERLERIVDGQVAAGLTKGDHGRRHLRALEAAANKGVRKRRGEPTPIENVIPSLVGMGIDVETEDG